jgi:hypothetical protein
MYIGLIHGAYPSGNRAIVLLLLMWSKLKVSKLTKEPFKGKGLQSTALIHVPLLDKYEKIVLYGARI